MSFNVSALTTIRAQQVRSRATSNGRRRSRQSVSLLLSATAAAMSSARAWGTVGSLSGTSLTNGGVSLTISGNWTPTGVPGSTDEAEIPAGYQTQTLNIGMGASSLNFGDLIVNSNANYNVGSLTSGSTQYFYNLSGGQGVQTVTDGGSSADLILIGSNVTSGTINLGGNYGTTAGSGALVKLLASGNIDVVNSGATLNIVTVISGATFGFSKTGLGTLNLSAANTYTGTTTVAGGQLNLTSSGSISSTSVLQLGGGGLTLATAHAAQAFASTTVLAGTSTVTAPSMASATANLSFGAITRNVAGGTINLTLPTTGSFTSTTLNTNGILGGYATIGGTNWVSSAGTGSVAGALSAYTGYTTSNATTLATSSTTNYDVAATGAGFLAANSLRYNTAAAITTTVAGTTAAPTVITSGGILVTSAVGANTTNLSGGTLTTGNGSDLVLLQYNTLAPLVISGVIANGSSGATGLTKSGPGMAILTATAAYAGPTYVNGGILEVGAGGTSGSIASSSTATIASGAMLAYNRSSTAITSLFNLAGPGTFASVGTGSLYLSAYTNTSFTGTINVASGTIGFIRSSNLGADTASVTIGAGTLLYNASTPTETDLGSNRAFSVTAATSTINVLGTASTVDTLTIAGVISGSGSLTKTGLGTLGLFGSNTYLGTTTVSTGVLQLNTGGTLGAGAVVDNATLINAHADALTIANNISGTGAFIQSGAGSLLLTGTNSYAGGTAISAGSVEFQNAVSLPSTGAVTVATGATAILAVGGAGQLDSTGVDAFRATATFNSSSTLGFDTTNASSGFAYGTVISDPAAGPLNLLKVGPNTLILTGASAYSGSTNISAGTLQVGNGDTTATIGSGPITNNGALVFNRADAITVGNAISGTGSFQQAGGSVLTLTGTNTYSGTTNISSGGTLQVGNGGASGTLGTGAITDNGVLAFNTSSATTISTVIGGTGVVQQFLGTVTSTNTATTGWFTGGLNISGGVYSVAVYAGVGQSPSTTPSNLQIGNNGTLNYAIASTNIFTSRLFQINAGGATISSNGAGGSIRLGQSDSSYSPSGSIGFGSQTTPVTLTLTGTSTGSNAISANLGDNSNGAVTSLVKDGSGFWAVAAITNTYSGGTTVKSGTLDLFNPGSAGSGNISIGAATLELFNFTFTGSHTYAAMVNAVQLTDATSTIQIGTTGNTALAGQVYTLSGPITGNALTKSGPGVLILSGNNSYSGGTTVSDGTLVANSTGGSNSATGSQAVTVGIGGTLAGGKAPSGTVAGATGQASGPVILNGTISAGSGALAGNTVGVLSTGVQTWNAGAIYAPKIDFSKATPNVAVGSGLSGTPGVASDELILAGGLDPSSLALAISPVATTAGASSLVAGQYSFIIAYDPSGGANSDTSHFDNLLLTSFTLPASSTAGTYGLSTKPDTAGTGEFLVLDFTSAAPEPTSLMLAGLAMAPLTLGRRRRSGSAVIG